MEFFDDPPCHAQVSPPSHPVFSSEVGCQMCWRRECFVVAFGLTRKKLLSRLATEWRTRLRPKRHDSEISPKFLRLISLTADIEGRVG